MESPSNIRKPSLEKISPEFGSSFSVKHYADASENIGEAFWHFHPEIELVYVKGGNGKRHIGNHVSYYTTGELVLIGSNLPHRGFTNRLTGHESETVIQFRSDFLGDGLFESNEMQDIKKLLTRSRAGIVFHGIDKENIGARIEKMAFLDNFAKLIELMCILQDLAWANEYEILNADGYVLEVSKTDNDRINKIYNHVQQHFNRPIPLSEIAQLANMTVPAFCRYFKKISSKTFTQFVNDIRIVHACKLLAEKPLSIANVSMESGFKNFSHFSRQFKEITGKSPTDYRSQFKTVLETLV